MGFVRDYSRLRLALILDNAVQVIDVNMESAEFYWILVQVMVQAQMGTAQSTVTV
jgi:hypothetical protein